MNRESQSLQASTQRLDQAVSAVTDRLLAAMHPDGWWKGRLSSSALSTATAVSALSVAADGAPGSTRLVRNGVAWLIDDQNADGGWGDTPDSPSNVPTTTLCIAAMHLAGVETPACSASLDRARRYIAAVSAGRGLAETLTAIYGKDRTFAAPILANCALAGLVEWDDVPRLPYELAALPRGLYRALRLHVVSYALPALIAIGLLVDARRTSLRPLRNALHLTLRGSVLGRLERMQPAGGGYLEAVPLTSFVAMTLAPQFGAGHPVAADCLEFIRRSARPDGSWAIDSNLSGWLTTNAVKALASAGQLGRIDAARTRQWIAACQWRRTHPYTNSQPGGWAWTHLPGGVPDTDDTASAILAMSALQDGSGVAEGARWLLKIQNADGGWPTFCRGWGKLPFDRSSPDLTAHAMRALNVAGGNGQRGRSIERGLAYLANVQRPDGAWVPLWFGNQAAPGQHNPVIGTSLVLASLSDLNTGGEMADRGARYLCEVQNDDGGWGGDRGVASSIEETALAVAALAGIRTDAARQAAAVGLRFLLARIEDGTWSRPAPVGLYFASLWYSEELYPVIWTLEALGRARNNGIAEG